MLRNQSPEVCEELGEGIRIAHGALVPILWDAFVTRGIGKASCVARNCVERFQCVTVKETFRVGGGFVGDESIEEGVSSYK